MTSFHDLNDRLEGVLRGTGLFLRGGFHPREEDGVPACSDGAAARTVLIVGNAGPELWRAFQAAKIDPAERHPLDSWVNELLRRAADAISATAVNPMHRPHPPIQRWARRAEAAHPSPLGLMIHERFGLWHAYRGALLLPDTIDLPKPRTGASPCDDCKNKPCLRACPVDAFRPDGFDMGACADHVEGEGGAACRRLGCLARRACPVGREWRYPDEACAYHMKAVVSTVRRMQSAQ